MNLKKYSENEIVARAHFQDGIERFEVRDQQHEWLRKHSKLRDYRRAYGKEILQYYIFSTIRNPWDKLVSLYFSPHRSADGFDPLAFERMVRNTPTLEIYLARSKLNRMFFSRDHIARLMKFERIDEDFAALCEDLGLRTEPLAVRNRSDRLPYRECFSKSLADFVASRHSTEIRLGNYKF